MSEQVERRLLEVLDRPTESPYGTPIPGLEELGLPSAALFLDGVHRATVVTGEHVVRRLGEPIQSDLATLRRLREAGIAPGATVTIAEAGRDRVVTGERGTPVVLPPELAQHLYVAADRS